MRVFLAGALPACVFVAVAIAAARPEPMRAEPARAEPAQGEDALPGVRLAITGAEGASQAQRVRLVALRVRKGSAPGGLVAAGAFEAEFRGRITVPLRDRYTFAFEGVGKATLVIGGKTVLDVARDDAGITAAPKRTRLKKGANEFVLRYESKADGSGACRLLWQGFGFAQELVPPSVLSVSQEDALEAWLGDAGKARGLALHGRTVAATRQCSKCHAVDAKPRMTELKRRGTKLDGIGARVQRAWLEAWLRDPRALRPTARMPRLLHGEGAAADARDLAAWLASLRDGAEELPDDASLAGDAGKGGQLFAALGCVSCHTRPDADAEAPVERKSSDVASVYAPEARIPLRFVAAKWQRPALVAFLENPATWDRWIRMPDFDLTRAEASDVAAYLLRASAGELPEASAGADASRGAKLAAELGCAACHALGELQAPAAKPWKELSGLEDGARCSHADAGLREAEVMALQAFQASDPSGASFGNHCASEFAARQIRELRCTSCHSFDGASDAWTAHEAEVADIRAKADADEVDQLRPPLTWAGEKLRSEWVTGFLRGDIEKPRPWLHARMPRFRSRARDLADGLAAMHGLVRTKKSEIPPAKAQEAKLGARIVGAKGHACTTCHSFGQHGATMVFESPGINLALASRRLRPAFYARWMLDPQRFDARTKMTKFADEKGRTQLEAFDGDARAQFEAVWQYLLGGDKMGPPTHR